MSVGQNFKINSLEFSMTIILEEKKHEVKGTR